MTNENLLARCELFIKAEPAKVWEALTNADLIRQYMFGAYVSSDWKEGSNITWEGDWQGKKYEDHGKVLRSVPDRLLQYTHISGLTAAKESHTITITLDPEHGGTKLTLAQDGNATKEGAVHAAENWNKMLQGLKQVSEQNA